MCGIAGFFGTGDRDILKRMTAALAHRGPDGEGYYCNETARIFLGHRRLAVLDIAGGAQPMKNSDASTVIVFNGEIYNHHELRAELEAAGQRFLSDHSDTEVLLRGYDVWGPALVEKLDGMFAFAIYDAQRRRLFLARDHFGEKPLFYCLGSEGLSFSSELQSLRLHPSAGERGFDQRAIQKLFAYTFLPGAITPYRGLRKLLPGSMLIYDCETGQGAETRYWRFSIAPDNPPAGSEAAWTEELLHLLSKAVTSRLESDVPLGIFLSGGLDSSTVAALAARAGSKNRISTHAIAFNEKSFDESQYAQQVAEFLGTRHSAATCDFSYMLHEAPRILGRIGDLLGDPSFVPTYMLAEETRRRVTVALTGDGSDELFGGYEPFKILRKAEAYQRLVPRPVHQALRVLWARVPVSEGYMSLDFKVGRALRGLSHGPNLWNPVWLAALSPDEMRDALDDPLPLEELYAEAITEWESGKGLSVADRTLEFFTNIYLPDDILVKSDRAGMLHGLEIRAPFLARDLVEFVRRLPYRVKVRNGNVKWILKQAVTAILPWEIVNRPKKGFGIPVSRWLREMGPIDWVPVPGVNDETFRAWNHQHSSLDTDHRGALWCRLVLDANVRSHGAVSTPDPAPAQPQ